MNQCDPFEPFDLRLPAPRSQSLRDSACRERAIPVSRFSVDVAEHGELMVLALFEMQARLGWQYPIGLRRRSIEGSPHCRWWRSAGPGFRERPALETAAILASTATSEALPDAIMIDLHSHQELEANVSADLVVTCTPGDDHLVVAVRVKPRWCQTVDPESEMDALAEMFSTLLGCLLSAPGLRPNAVDAISSDQRRFVLGPLAGRQWNFGDFRPLPLLLRDCTTRYGERVAYRHRDQTLTFTEFEQLANGLAQTLVSKGIRQGDVIPVMFRNGLEMPLAYYALMKCGAGLVPVDFDWPEDRLVQALSQFSSSTILCSEEVVLPVGFKDKRHAVRLEDIQRSGVPVSVRLRPDDVIYGFFTSGTTGAPKCALNTHAALANRFAAMNRYLGDIGGPVLQNTRYMYDSSIGHMFLAITQGHQVVIPEESATLNLSDTIEAIGRYGVVMTDFVPSVLNQLVTLIEKSESAQRTLSCLRELIVGGEQITPKMVQKLRSLLSPDLRISNCYGITETAIGLTYHPVRDEDTTNIPLGRPLDNCYLFVVDDELRPLPRGATGQILVGGACVGSGYMNNPERTAAVFIDNPFPEMPGKTIYCTGDRGYFDGNGNLQFQGRRDSQAKVGGVLFEPAEVENAASAMPAVYEARAFVVVRDDYKSIALVAAGAMDLDRAALARHLKSKLPRSLLPKHILIVPAMPVANSGKLDQRKLQEMLEASLSIDHAVAGPDKANEERGVQGRVLTVFRAVLSNHTFAVHDDFFEMGGDSLQALTVAMRIEEIFEIPFGTADLVECPTPATAAGRVEALKRGPIAPVCPAEEDIAELGKTIPQSFRSVSGTEPDLILLTGATGFVGSYLARELLSKPGKRIVALCRASSSDDLAHILARKKLWTTEFGERLEIVYGDLATPRLGLDKSTWERIASRCDAVLHCGAMVNFVYDYRVHRDANVIGTRTLLEFANTGKAKSFHFISTMGVLQSDAGRLAAVRQGETEPERIALPRGGYSQSKLVAENIVALARQRGLDARIYRLGEVMPASEGGLPNERALAHMLLAAFAATGSVPMASVSSDWTPVDLVARQIVDALLDTSHAQPIYHLFDSIGVTLNSVLQRAGLKLDAVPEEEWLRRLDRQISLSPMRELRLLRSMFPEGLPAATLRDHFSTLMVDNTRIAHPSSCFASDRAAAREAQTSSIQRYAAYLMAQAALASDSLPAQVM